MEIGAYSDIVDEIIKNDPKDETGYAKKAKAIKKQAVMNKIGKAAMEHFQNKDFDGAIAYLDKAVGESGLDKEAKQQLLFLKDVILAEQEKFDEALEMLESVKAVAPESEAAGQFDQVRGQIEAAKKAKANQGGEKKEESKEETKEAPKPAKK
jgi:tetratricopeptide (TPR) repeat protein